MGQDESEPYVHQDTQQGAWNWMVFKVTSNLSQSVVAFLVAGNGREVSCRPYTRLLSLSWFGEGAPAMVGERLHQI